jgi:hypothetical protein
MPNQAGHVILFSVNSTLVTTSQDVISAAYEGTLLSDSSGGIEHHERMASVIKMHDW